MAGIHPPIRRAMRRPTTRRMTLHAYSAAKQFSLAMFGQISLMYADRRDQRAYFYRTHSTCHEGADEPARVRIDGIVLDMIAKG